MKPRSSPSLSLAARLSFLGASLLMSLSACGRSSVDVAQKPPDSQHAVQAQDAAVERDAQTHLAAQNRAVEQQLANRKAMADVRGVGTQMQERLQQEWQTRHSSGDRSINPGGGEPLLLAQAEKPSPSPTVAPQPAPTDAAKPQPSASATAAPKTEPKYQEPPNEDKSDSMKPEAGRTKPSPSPSPTPKSAPQKSDGKSGESAASSSASPSASPKRP